MRSIWQAIRDPNDSVSSKRLIAFASFVVFLLVLLASFAVSIPNVFVEALRDFVLAGVAGATADHFPMMFSHRTGLRSQPEGNINAR